MLTLDILGSGSSGNCYLLNCDGKILILDAGIPIKDIKRGLNYNLLDVVGCFTTHGHKDHSMSVEDLRLMGIPIFEPYKSEMERRVVNYDGFVIKSFPLPHDGVENRGFYIACPNGHRMLYMSDFEYCPYSFSVQKINTLLIECNYNEELIEPEQLKYDHVLRGHASLGVTKRFVEVNKTSELETVVLCHLSATNADPETMVKEIKSILPASVDVLVAERGLMVDLEKEF